MTIFEELRHAARSLARSKGFTLSASLTLALALGLTTPIFGVLDQALHPYTPISDPDRVVIIQPVGPPRSVTAWERYRMVRDGTRFVEGMAPVVRSSSLVETPTVRSQVNMATVPPDYFKLLGIAPAMGRTFSTPAQDQDAVILGVELWRAFFPGRTSVTGATLTIDGRIYNVIGVMPERTGGAFLVTDPARPPTPLERWVTVTARIKRGVSLDEVDHELGIVARRLTQEHGDVRRPARFEVAPAAPSAEAQAAGFILIYGGTGLAILGIACANLANLMLVRGVGRRKEIALKMAMGASRGRVVRQLVFEALMIAAFSATIAVPLSVWSIDVFRYAMPLLQPSHYSHSAPHMGWRAVLFVFASALATGVIVGVYPGLRASEISLDEPLKETAGGVTAKSRRRHALLATIELALALPLLVETAYLIRSVVWVSRFDFGFESSHMLLGPVYFNQADSGATTSAAIAIASGVPGVLSATTLWPPGGAGTPITPDTPLPSQRLEAVRVGYGSGAGFEATLGVPMVRGRSFELGDYGQQVAIVNQTAAHRLWGDGVDPVGHLLRLGPTNYPGEWHRVIGVIRDANVAYTGPSGPGSVVFLPDEPGRSWASLVLRTDDVSGRVSSDVARELRTRLGLKYAPTFRSWREGTGLSQAMQVNKVGASIMGVFGGTSLLFASVGLYGVLAFTVGQRRREYAVRMALGATPNKIYRGVLRHAFSIVLAGTGLGAFIALAVAQLVAKSPYSTFDPTDAVALAGAELFLCLVAFLACLGPARRAMKADPAEILRAV